MTKIRCKVNSCQYWGTGEVCQADSISVNNNMFDDMEFDAGLIEEEYADELSFAFDMEVDYEMGLQGNSGDIRASTANTSMQTQCETMRPRRS